MKTSFVVKVINQEKDIIGGYVRELDLPFVPVVGMKFRQGISATLWETKNDQELDPSIKETIYDLDDELIYCLFEINQFLKSNFWQEINQENLYNSYELSKFI